MPYLLLGKDKPAKDSKIDELKKQHLPSPGAMEFDYEVLYGHKLDPDTLQKALLALPAVSAKRFLLIRECHKLSPHNRELVIRFLKQKQEKVFLVLDSDELEPQDSFVKSLQPLVKVVDFYRPAVRSVFDMTKAIDRRDPAEALRILGELLNAGVHPLQMMPAVVWFWGQTRNRVSREKFQEGLSLLQKADLNIKRSRLKPEQAIELVVVQLSALI